MSSNTHSLSNLVTGLAREREDELVAFVEHGHHEDLQRGARALPRRPHRGLVGELPVLRRPRLLRCRRPRAAAQAPRGRGRGRRRRTSARRPRCACRAQVIPLARLDPARLDPRLGSVDAERLARSEAVIVNIDYPLGLAAYNILREVAVDSADLRGVYVLGKAATLNADVGDVMISSVIHDEHSGTTYWLDNAFTVDDIAPYLVFGSGLDNQRAVTVKSTFLQNREYLDFYYREAFTVVEMEAGPYCNAVYEIADAERYPVGEAVNFSKLPIDFGIIHYASDTPYTQARTLGARGLSYYGMDSTYASSLAILRRVLRLEGALREAHVEVEGPPDGAPVVFLHGVSGSLRTYAWLTGAITEGRRIVRLDLRGHGRSAHAPGTYTVDRYGEDVVGALRETVGRPAVLVGHSLGGVVAWWVAQRHPELVAAAFLEDPPLYMGEAAEHRTTAPWRFRRHPQRGRALEGDRDDARPGGRRAGCRAHLRGVVRRRPPRAGRSAAAHGSRRPSGAIDASTLAPTDTASPVSVPVFLLAADFAGSALAAHHAQRLAISHPDVEIVRVPGAGHGIHDEREHPPSRPRAGGLPRAPGPTRRLKACGAQGPHDRSIAVGSAEPADHCRERRAHVGGLEANLRAREAQRSQPGRGVRLVAHPILGLLRRRAVVAQAVGLHHEPQLRPEEVDLEAVNLAIARCRRRQPGAARDRQEAAFELRVGERERSPVERGPQPAEPGLRRSLVERRAQPLGVDEVELVASLIAASSRSRPSVAATSMSVAGTEVTGMPSRRSISSSLSAARRCTRRPAWRRFRWWARHVDLARALLRHPQSAAALAWLSTASAPHARTAAIHCPRASTAAARWRRRPAGRDAGGRSRGDARSSPCCIPARAAAAARRRRAGGRPAPRSRVRPVEALWGPLPTQGFSRPPLAPWLAEGVGVRGRPLLEAAWRATQQLLDGRLDLRLVQIAVDVEVEERVDVLRRHLIAHLRPRVGIRQRLQPQLAPERCAEDADAVGGQQRFGPAQDVGTALVPVGAQRARRHLADVLGIEHGDRDVRERLAHHVARAQLVAPAQRVGHEREWPQDRRRGMPEPFTAASERSMYAVTALLVSPLAAELPDSSTTRSTPASRIAARTPFHVSGRPGAGRRRGRPPARRRGCRGG